MTLDLTQPGRCNPEPHWRRYLAGDQVKAVCVQDFDYHDYDTSRFVDSDIFGTEVEAEMAPVNVGPLLDTIQSSGDREARAQALRNLRAVLAAGLVAATPAP